MPSVFGVELTGESVALAHERPREPRVAAVERVRRGAVDAGWPDGSERLVAKRRADGVPFLTVEAHPAGGYRVWADWIGLHRVSADGSRIESEPPVGRPWHDDRLLAAQVLPLVALLQGVEVLHAGAVSIDGRVWGLVAASGAGKSSTIAHLLDQGTTFVADDGLGLECADGRVVAHPGPRALNLDARELDALGDRGALLGERIGESAALERTEVQLRPRSNPSGLELAGLALLERTPDARGATTVQRDAGLALLGSVHASFLRTPVRLRRQLEVTAAVARLPVVRLAIGREEPAAVIARRVLEWMAP